MSSVRIPAQNAGSGSRITSTETFGGSHKATHNVHGLHLIDWVQMEHPLRSMRLREVAVFSNVVYNLR